MFSCNTKPGLREMMLVFALQLIFWSSGPGNHVQRGSVGNYVNMVSADVITR